MAIIRATKDDLKNVAEEMINLPLGDIREEIAEMRAAYNRMHESIIALTAQIHATNHRVTNEFHRSQKSREAILKRLAELENAKGLEL